MEQRSVEETIKEALVRSLKLKIEPHVIPDDIPLVEKGLGLDSVSILHVVGAVEKTFDITFDDRDIRRELFTDISTLAAYVRQRLTVAQSQAQAVDS